MKKKIFSNMKKFLIVLSIFEMVEIKLRSFQNQQETNYQVNQDLKFDLIFLTILA
jgi:hypothetical protein